MPGSSNWSFRPGFPTKTQNTPVLPHKFHTHRPSHFLDSTTRKILGEQYRSLSSYLCSFLHSHVTSSISAPNIPLSTLFSNTLSLRFSLNMSDQVSHPQKTRGKIIVWRHNYLKITNFKTFSTETDLSECSNEQHNAVSHWPTRRQ